jgi:hypothetical protein
MLFIDVSFTAPVLFCNLPATPRTHPDSFRRHSSHSGHVPPQKTFTRISRTSSDPPPAPSLSFSPSGSPVGLHNALAIYYTFVAGIPIYSPTITGHANTNNFLSYDRVVPRCTIPDMFELIATQSSPLSRVYNDPALSPLSNSSPTVVAFAKAREEHFFRLLSDANERHRGHMQRRV